MRKLFTVMFALLATGSLFAGGLVTNTNQSAAWVRMPARNASTSVDAAYYNPAGLMKLDNGFHFSVSNQSIWQTREIENFYKGPNGAFGLNESLFKGKATAPIFPSVYGVYKTDRLAFSLGFNPIGGGGGATYEKGLPSFEVSASDLVPSLAATHGATGYRLNAYLEGKSVFFGLQGAVSFKVNDWLSVAAGLRYVMAKNSYMGYLKDIQVNITNGGWTDADLIMTGIVTQINGIIGVPAALQPTISGGGGGLTLSQLVAGGMSQAQADGIAAGLAFIGVPSANIPLMTASQISSTITTATPTLTGKAATYGATAILLDNQEVDAEQSGSGFAPFFSVNISPNENLNIAVKYEMKTRMEIENSTKSDFLVGFTATGNPITMFADGDITPSDMPALLTLGLSYKLGDMATVALGGNYYFDKSANYGKKLDLDNNSATPSTFVKNEDIIENNGLSVQAGLELNLSEKILVSGGWSWANKGVNDKYQSDLTYGLATHTFGIGGAYKITPNIQFNLGGSMTMYMDGERMVDHVFSGTGVLYQNKETYAKRTMLFGAGLDFSF